MLKQPFLSHFNTPFVKMYEYDFSEDMIGLRFPQLFDKGEASKKYNLHKFPKNGKKVRDIESIAIGKNGIRKYSLSEIIGIVEHNHLVLVWGV